MLMRCERAPRGAGYVIHVSRMAESLPAGSHADRAHAVACASAINRAVEALVRGCPGQYLWAYDRYKQPNPTLALDEGGR